MTAGMGDLGESMPLDSVRSIFEEYDMMSLWAKVEALITDGYADPDTVLLQLRETPEYQQRFAANAARKRNNHPELEPATYLRYEKQLREVIQQSGLPNGFYRDRTDLQGFIENDTSPFEISARIGTASTAAASADPAIKQALKDYYNIDEQGIVAYFLDPTKAAELLTSQYGAAVAGGSFKSQGIKIDKGIAEEIGASGINPVNVASGAAQVAGDMRSAADLGNIYGEDFTSEDLTRSTFDLAGGAAATKKKNRLASAERAAFSGSSGTQSGSLTSKSASGMI